MAKGATLVHVTRNGVGLAVIPHVRHSETLGFFSAFADIPPSPQPRPQAQKNVFNNRLDPSWRSAGQRTSPSGPPSSISEKQQQSDIMAAQPEALSAPAQTFENAPPFPDDVPTAPLLRLSLAKLLDRDAEEVIRFIRACEDLGFFYLDLSGPGDSLLADADGLFDVGARLYDLPLDEKKKYDFMHKNSYFGYKGYGANVVDRAGNLDRNEFYNVSDAEC